MLYIHKKMLIGGLFGLATLSLSFAVTSTAYAQMNYDPEPLADFSVEMDELPPQPTQSTLPEEEGVTINMDAVPIPKSNDAGMIDLQQMPQDDVSVEVSVSAPESMAPPTETLMPIEDMPELAEEPAVEEPPYADLVPIPHSGQYYDAASLVPDAAIRSAIGPREVDPRYEPGSRFVVVQKGLPANSVAARLVQAQRALKLGRYSSALELYEQLYKKSPKSHQVLMGLAVAQQYNGFTESAIATYEELLAHEPNNTDAMVNMLGLLQTQYPAVAYRKLRDLWEKDSQNPGLAAQLGLTSASIGNAQEAIRYLGIAVTMEPDNPSHYFNMAVVTDRSGAHKDAVELYQKALEIDAATGSNDAIPREQIYDRLADLRRL